MFGFVEVTFRSSTPLRQTVRDCEPTRTALSARGSKDVEKISR